MAIVTICLLAFLNSLCDLTNVSKYGSTHRVLEPETMLRHTLLQQLDWLPVEKCCDEKILELTFKFQSLYVSHLFELLNKKWRSCSPRLTDGHRIVTTAFQLRTVSVSCLSSPGPDYGMAFRALFCWLQNTRRRRIWHSILCSS